MAAGQFEQARAQLEECLAIDRETCDPASTVWHLAQLGHVARAMMDDEEAKTYYRQALQISIDTQDSGGSLDVLTGWAALLAQEGDKAKALEWVALAMRHPHGEGTWWTGIEDREKKLLAELQAGLPPDAFTAALERGQTRDLWATVQELLTELAPDEPE